MSERSGVLSMSERRAAANEFRKQAVEIATALRSLAIAYGEVSIVVEPAHAPGETSTWAIELYDGSGEGEILPIVTGAATFTQAVLAARDWHRVGVRR